MVNQSLKKVLESHTVATLRKEITKARRNMFGATSKMKKAQLINHMLKTPSHFKHLKMNVRKTRIRTTPTGRRSRPRKDAMGLSSLGLGLSGGSMNRRRLMMALRRSM